MIPTSFRDSILGTPDNGADLPITEPSGANAWSRRPNTVFLYAVRPGDNEAWSEVCEEVRRKLPGSSEVFSAALVAEPESTIFPCSVCRNLDGLELKIVVHSGEALFHTIGGFADIPGVDVILAHRLLKNSVASDEYILMTEPAYRELEVSQLSLGAHPTPSLS